MQNEMTAERLVEMRGTPVYASDGDQIGKVEEIYLDDQSGQPEWIGLGTGFLGTKRVLVPVSTAENRDGGFYVPYTKDHVQGAPDIDSDHIDPDVESSLYEYYSLESGRMSGDIGEVRETDTASVTRSEEELQVGTRESEIGRVRLRKYVETEPVQMDVALQRETAQVRTEQIDQPVTGAEFGEEQVEVPLHGEEAVVAKQARAKERVSVDTDVETEHTTVSDEVRKERVEVEGDDAIR